jgi:hypothetical protein
MGKRGIFREVSIIEDYQQWGDFFHSITTAQEFADKGTMVFFEKKDEMAGVVKLPVAEEGILKVNLQHLAGREYTDEFKAKLDDCVEEHVFQNKIDVLLDHQNIFIDLETMEVMYDSALKHPMIPMSIHPKAKKDSPSNTILMFDYNGGAYKTYLASPSLSYAIIANTSPGMLRPTAVMPHAGMVFQLVFGEIFGHPPTYASRDSYLALKPVKSERAYPAVQYSKLLKLKEKLFVAKPSAIVAVTKTELEKTIEEDEKEEHTNIRTQGHLTSKTLKELTITTLSLSELINYGEIDDRFNVEEVFIDLLLEGNLKDIERMSVTKGILKVLVKNGFDSKLTEEQIKEELSWDREIDLCYKMEGGVTC